MVIGRQWAYRDHKMKRNNIYFGCSGYRLVQFVFFLLHFVCSINTRIFQLMNLCEFFIVNIFVCLNCIPIASKYSMLWYFFSVQLSLRVRRHTGTRTWTARSTETTQMNKKKNKNNKQNAETSEMMVSFSFSQTESYGKYALFLRVVLLFKLLVKSFHWWLVHAAAN